ncbi:MAG TPA: hypothetical protein VJS15_06990 [Allosphingosinicella sp.]|nr:hypothetical protein [Allosphingosinicella sp.]
MDVRRFWVLLLVGLLAACSLRGAMNAMTSEEDRAFAQAMVDNLRTGNHAWLEQHFDPALWQESSKQLAEVPALYPPVPGTTELVAYNFQSNNLGSGAQRNQEFTLVTEGGGRWAVTRFKTFAAGGAAPRVVQWSVVPHATEPSELTMLKAMDRAVPWMWGGAGFVLLLIVGIVWLIVRSNRRKRDSPIG